MAEMYGGDEINAAVIDTGAMWTRVGLAGGLAPIVTLPTSYTQTGEERKYGDVPLLVPKPEKEVYNPVSDSIVHDWQAVEGLWSHGIKECGLNIEELPLLFTEQLWAPDTQRQKILELALEKFNAPATYIAKSPVCSLFSAGRSSGLVVDIGHQTVGITPVVDGLVLYKPARRSRKAGEFLNSKIVELVGEPVPSFKVASRDPFVERSVATTESFTKFHARKVVEDFKESMVQVSTGAETPVEPRSYEFPDGHSVEYGAEREVLGDHLFNDSGDEEDEPMDDKLPVDWSSKGVSSLVIDAIKSCDVDIRANLANNIVVTGGTSLTQKFTERLNNDITNAFPGLKVRIHAPGNYTERKNSAWIGGSILASLGTFHQMWISKKEYEEVGVDQLIQKRFG